MITPADGRLGRPDALRMNSPALARRQEIAMKALAPQGRPVGAPQPVPAGLCEQPEIVRQPQATT